MMDPKLKALREKLAKAQADMGKFFDEAGKEMDFSKVKIVAGTEAEKIAALKKMNEACATIQKEMEPLMSVEKARTEWEERNGIVRRAPHPDIKAADSEQVDKFGRPQVLYGEHMKAMREMSDFGGAFIKAKANLPETKGKKIMLDEKLSAKAILKTNFTTSAGWAPESLRTGRVIEEATRPIGLLDLIPMGQTGMAAVVYMEETTFTNNAAEAAEAGSYGEAALALTEQSSTVRKIAVFIPVTDEQLEDVPQVQGYLNNRLPFMLRQRLSSQIANGNGGAPNLTGILNNGSIQSIAQADNAGDLVTDVLFRASTLIRVNAFADATGIMMHPNDWQAIRLLKTNNGNYIWGHPSEAGPDRIWGLPVSQDTALTAKTAIVGAFNPYCELVERRGIEVLVSNSHASYFTSGLQAIRADMRAAFVIYRPEAFVQVTLT